MRHSWRSLSICGGRNGTAPANAGTSAWSERRWSGNLLPSFQSNIMANGLSSASSVFRSFHLSMPVDRLVVYTAIWPNEQANAEGSHPISSQNLSIMASHFIPSEDNGLKVMTALILAHFLRCGQNQCGSYLQRVFFGGGVSLQSHGSWVQNLITVQIAFHHFCVCQTCVCPHVCSSHSNLCGR